MQQCPIYDGSLRFSRATYGVLLLVAFFVHSQWLVLGISILTILGAFSLKLNIPYQLHVLFLKDILKKKFEPIQKNPEELSFVSATTGILLLIGFFFIYFGKFVEYAWIYILIVTFMIFLACFLGFCVATMMYIFLKRLFSKDNLQSIE